MPVTLRGQKVKAKLVLTQDEVIWVSLFLSLSLFPLIFSFLFQAFKHQIVDERIVLNILFKLSDLSGQISHQSWVILT